MHKLNVKHLIGTLCVLILSSAYAYAQTTINGTVLDAQKGTPLISATVQVKGTANGTFTDASGKFSVSVPEGKDTLVVSYIGYNRKIVSIGTQRDLRITLEPTALTMKEVVVIGYGTQVKRNVVGSIGKVDSEKFKDQPVLGIDQAMQGQVAGVNISQASGAPGGGVSVRIRGIASIGAGSEPLYVIDGVPFYNSANTGVGGRVQPSNPLSAINPADIESIDILKDASATAIYGSRGANGVVIITTKRGKAGLHNIQFTAQYGFQELANPLNTMDRQTYDRFVREARNNYYAATGNDTADSDIWRLINLGTLAIIPNFDQFNVYPGFDSINGTDWQDEIFRTGVSQQYQLTATGGTEKITYAISAGYFEQEGIIINSDFERFSLRSNIDAKINDRIRAGVSLSGSYTLNNQIQNAGNFAQGGVVNAALVMPPSAPIYEPDGSYFNLASYFSTNAGGIPSAAQMPGVLNPVMLAREYTLESKNLRSLNSAYVELEILKSLKFRSTVGLDLNSFRTRSFAPEILQPSYFPGASSFVSQEITWVNTNTLSFDKTFGTDHQVQATAVYEVQKSNLDATSVNAIDFDDETNPFVNNNTASVQNGAQALSEWALISYVFRGNYVFKDRYLLTATVRRDGSSRFGANNRFGTFPSVALGWRVSSEPFMESVNWVDELKFRASYGVTGNSEIGNYSHIGLISASSYNIGPGRGNVAGALFPTTASNQELTWETTKQLNIGLDFSILEAGRIRGSIDYYEKKTDGLLLLARVPSTSGFSQFIQNVGEVNNRGWEFSITSYNIQAPFSWKTDFNISFNENEVTKLSTEGERLFTDANHVTEQGSPIGNFFGYISDGIYQTQEEIEAAGNLQVQGRDPYPGSRRYRDVNGDGKIDGADQTIIGNPLPKWNLGFTNTFSYKGVELSVLITGMFGHDIYNLGRNIYDSNIGFHSNTITNYNNRWQSVENPGDGNTAIAQAGDLYNNRLNGSWLVEKGDFVRVRNLTLGYIFPKSWIEKVGLQQVRVYSSIQNLHTWTNYSGYDPEVSSSGINPQLAGIDFGAYPLARTYTIGVNLGF